VGELSSVRYLQLPLRCIFSYLISKVYTKMGDLRRRVSLGGFTKRICLQRTQYISADYANIRSTPDDALVVWNILSFYTQIQSQFVKPPSDTLLHYFNIFHDSPSAITIISTIQLVNCLICDT
jgi:hypothetical protein